MANTLVEVPLTGGINLLKDVRRIRDDQAVKTQNLVPVTPGVLKTRPGSVIEFFETANADLAVPIALVSVPYGQNWPDHIRIERAITGTAVNTRAYALSFNDSSAGAIADLAAVTQNVPQVLSTAEKVYVFPGHESPYPGKVLEYNGVTGTSGGYDWVTFAFAGTGNTNIFPKVASVFRERVLYSDLGPGLESWMLLSDTGFPDIVGNDAISTRGFTAGDGDGDRIVATQEITQTSVGSPSQAGCLILKEYSAYILAGLPSESADAFDLADLSINKISYPCGCASRETLVQTPFGLIWAGPDDVWLFATGQLPVRIGGNIRAALTRTPANLRYRWHAAYHNGFYRLAVFGEGQGPDDDSPCQDQWWLDLRDGPPQGSEDARWWGPQQYKFVAPDSVGSYQQAGTHNMMLRRTSGQDDQLYSLIAGYGSASAYYLWAAVLDNGGSFEANTQAPRSPLVPWVATTAYVVGNMVTGSGNAYKCVFAGTSGATEPSWTNETLDGTARFLYVGPSWAPIISDTTTTNSNVEVELVTKVYDFGEPILRKMFQASELDMYTSESGRVVWDVVLDDGRETALNQILDLQDTGFINNDDVLDTGTAFSREFQSLRCSPDDDTRLLGKLVQFKLRTYPGYLIQEGYNDQFIFCTSVSIFETPLNGNVHIITIPAGYYASITTLMAAIQTAINAYTTVYGMTITVSRAEYGVIKFVTSTGTIGYDANNTLGQTTAAIRRGSALLGLVGAPETTTAMVAKTLTGVDPVRYTRSPTLELGSIMLRIRPVMRRPA